MHQCSKGVCQISSDPRNCLPQVTTDQSVPLLYWLSLASQ